MLKKTARFVVLASMVPGATTLSAQPRSMAQDASLNNLVHPPTQSTVPIGELGAVRVTGKGPRHLILIPGMGSGASVFDEFGARYADRFTIRTVTLAGFGGTPAPVMPPAGASFSTTPWSDGAVDAILRLMDREKIGKATLIAHWAVGTQIAVRLAAEHPERFDALVLVSPVPKVFYGSIPGMATWTQDQRIKYADGMAERWFKTVARQTWDDQNYMSYDYAVNPRRGLFLWREAASPSLPVWIRYLLEFYARDSAQALGTLAVPTLLVKPGFDDPAFYVEESRDYMRDLCLRSWDGVVLSPSVETVVLPQTRLFAMYDRPQEFDAAVNAFLDRARVKP